ncbi:hypothetical protein Tco_0212363 [Tanacetum coccineum]
MPTFTQTAFSQPLSHKPNIYLLTTCITFNNSTYSGTTRLVSSTLTMSSHNSFNIPNSHYLCQQCKISLSRDGKIKRYAMKMDTGYRNADHNLGGLVSAREQSKELIVKFGGNEESRIGKSWKDQASRSAVYRISRGYVCGKLLQLPTQSAFIELPVTAQSLTYSGSVKNQSRYDYEDFDQVIGQIMPAENKTGEVEKVFGMMAGLHADSGGAGVSDAGAEFATMEISPKDLEEYFGSKTCFDLSRPILPPSHRNFISHPQYKSDIEKHAASVPAGSRNSSASVTAGGSDPAARRNRPAVNSAGRPNPTRRVGQAAHLATAQDILLDGQKRSAPVSAVKTSFCDWRNPAARPYFRPSSVYFNNMYWPEFYDPMHMNEGQWGTAVKNSACLLLKE